MIIICLIWFRCKLVYFKEEKNSGISEFIKWKSNTTNATKQIYYFHYLSILYFYFNNQRNIWSRVSDSTDAFHASKGGCFFAKLTQENGTLKSPPLGRHLFKEIDISKKIMVARFKTEIALRKFFLSVRVMRKWRSNFS